jgi:hypothetical protein
MCIFRFTFESRRISTIMDECQADSHDKQHTGHRLLLQDEAVAASEGLWDRILCILFYDGSVKDCAINYSLTAVSLGACVVLLHVWQQHHHASITSDINPSGTNSSAVDDDATGAAATMAPSTTTDAKPSSATSATNDPAQWQRLVNDNPRQPLYNNNDTSNTRESRGTTAAATSNSTSSRILPPQPTSSAASAASSSTTCGPTYKAAIYSLVFVILFQIGLCLIAGCVGISVIWCAMAGWMVFGLLCDWRQRVRQQRNERTSSSSLSWFSRQTSSRTVAIVITTLFLDSVGIVYYAMTSELITTVAHACALALGAAVYKCTTSCGFTTGRRDCDYGTASTA